MEFQVSFKVSDKIYLKDPESTELGRVIIKNSIELIYEIGFEHFTFKKLAQKTSTTEATIYRYFENKHRLLLYILNWYWSYLEYLVVFQLKHIQDNGEKLKMIVELLTHELPESAGRLDYNKKYLNHIIISESSKVYLVKDVAEINKDEVFKPYKDLIAKIAEIITLYNPQYKYPRSLSSTLVETAHNQQFFSEFLPKLTDLEEGNRNDFTSAFLMDMLFRSLG